MIDEVCSPSGNWNDGAEREFAWLHSIYKSLLGHVLGRVIYPAAHQLETDIGCTLPCRKPRA